MTWSSARIFCLEKIIYQIGGKEVFPGNKAGFTPKMIMALTQKEISARFYKKRKENGLCPNCGKPLDREGFYCNKCLIKVREYRRENREFYRKHHICTECGKEIVYGTDRICFECRAKKYNRKKELSEEQKNKILEKNRERQKERYKELSEKGICVHCGKRKAVAGRKRCAICLEKDAYRKRKQRFDRQNIKDYRRENHLCYYCGNPIDLPSGQLCSSCMEKCKENGKKSSANNKFWKQDNKIVFMKAGDKV